MKFDHVPVLKSESIECLKIKEGEVYVDGTLGFGGHFLAILDNLNNTGLAIGIDKDTSAIEYAKSKLSKYSNFKLIHGAHEDVKNLLDTENIDQISGALLDLGVSSYQLDDETRGFSYMKDADLDMRMDTEKNFTAYNVVNEYSMEKLIDIFFKYGEEKFSRRIAKKICECREIKPISSTLELADIIQSVVPRTRGAKSSHPAKRVFQAIRIEVNGELVGLEKTIKDLVSLLKDGGRLVVISFHSLEDRIVKLTFEELEGRCTCPKSLPQCVCNFKSYGKIITKKPIIANEKELELNPRAKSAKLRVFERNEVKF